MLTLLLIIFPFIIATLLLIAGRNAARTIALGGAIIELGLAVTAIALLQNGHTELMSLKQDWIRNLGVSFNISIDGISMLLVLLATLLVPMIIYASFNRTYTNAHILYSLMLVMQGAMIGVFTAMDGFLFYIFWELALIPIYFICLVWGGENRQRITFKFFVYTLSGSLFMLLALIYLYLHTANGSFNIQDLYAAGRSLPVAEQGWIFAAFFLAFAIKMPVFPFHTWQPSTYYTAPTPGVMMLSGIMLKMATYGMIRWVLPMVPEGIAEYGHIAVILSVISIIYGSCIAIIQKDYKYVIAYASIAHVGLISASILAGNAQSLQGSLVEMLSHGISTVGLFFVYDIIVSRTGTSELKKLGGIRGKDSALAFLFFIIILSVVALPFTNGFVGEFLMILGLFEYSPYLSAIAGLSIILGVVYMFRSFQAMMLGETSEITASYSKLTMHERSMLYIIVALIICFGVYPKPILQITESSVITLLQGIK